MFKITKVTCDYRGYGEFIENKCPAFSWVMESDEKNIIQSTYRITVKSGSKLVWDSGKQMSSQSIHVPYSGKELLPLTVYTYKVEVESNTGEVACIESCFETGLLETDFKARFIYSGEDNDPDCSTPIHIFRKDFKLSKSNIVRARLFESAIGIFESEINGVRVSNEYFAPGNTNAFKHIQYVEYDVTSMLTSEFTISARVANGWQLGRVDTKTNYYSNKRGFICELHVFYSDGTSEVFKTDDTWEWTDNGPERFADFYDGEIYDANYTPSDFKSCKYLPEESCKKLIARLGVPVTEHEVLKPIDIIIDKDGSRIFDFGQNFAGVVKLKTNAKRGTVIEITHAELIHNGVFFTENLCTAKAKLTYICKGGGEEFMPHFTYMGFRYAKVKCSSECDIELVGVVLHSELEFTGKFTSSNAKINQLQSNIIWSGKANFIDIPTDCPQRDERLGWTGDIAVFASTAAYNMDISLFMRKWLFDLESEQVDGVVPFTVPDVNIFDKPQKTPTSGWSDAAAMVPWAVYMASGDKDILARQYESMKSWVDCEKRCCNERLIWEDGFQFGDWLAPDGAYPTWVSRNKWLASCYFANSADIVSKSAAILGFADDAEKYAKLRDDVKAAFMAEFVNDDGTFKEHTVVVKRKGEEIVSKISGFQSAYVCALWFDMLPENLRPKVLRLLVENIHDHGGLLNTGFLGTPYLTFALSDNGEDAEAFKMLLNEECPSWLYPVNLGATTVWERWDGIMPDGEVNIKKQNGVNASNINMVSFNHYAYGAVGDWLYRRLAGLECDTAGYKHFTVKPHIGGGFTYAHTEKISPYGLIKCGWRLENGVITIDVTVPVNTTATVYMPSGEKHDIGSGIYSYSEKYNN